MHTQPQQNLKEKALILDKTNLNYKDDSPRYCKIILSEVLDATFVAPLSDPYIVQPTEAFSPSHEQNHLKKLRLERMLWVSKVIPNW